MENELKLQEELTTAKAFLDEKIRKETKSLRLRLILGVVVTIIVFGYMFWFYKIITGYGSPEGMRTVIVTTVRAEAPQLLDLARKEILSQKSTIIDFVTKEGLENLVKVLMTEGEKKLHEMIAKISDETMVALNERFVTVLKSDGSRLKKLLSQPDQGAIEEEIVKAFDDDLQEAMGQMNFNEDFNEPLGKMNAEALAQLNDINTKLLALATKEKLNSHEAMTLRFIKLWAGYVNQMGDADPEDEDIPGTVAPRSPSAN
jgi:hypothetical protein